jgi:hypothetical protein
MSTSHEEEIDNDIQNTISIRFLLISYFFFFILYYIFYNAILTRALHEIYEKYSNRDHISNDIHDNYITAINAVLLKFQSISIVLLSLLFIVSNLLLYIFCLHGTNIVSTTLTLITCVLFITTPIMILCNTSIFIRVFENSIGYYIAKNICTTKEKNFYTFINKLFYHKLLRNVDYTFVFSMFTIHNFHQLIHDMKNNIINKYDSQINNINEKENLALLFDAVVSKNTIGQICWTYYAFVTGAILSHLIILPIP